MALPVVPPPPARGRLPSRPDAEHGEVWRTLGAVQAEVESVKAAVLRVETAQSSMAQAQASQNASTRSQTIQLIVAGVVTCVTAVFGARLTAPTPPPTQTVVQHTAYDRALDACKLLQADADRAACVVKVSSEAMGLNPR